MRTKPIQVWLNDEEYAAWWRAAGASSMSLSAWVRECCNKVAKQTPLAQLLEASVEQVKEDQF